MYYMLFNVKCIVSIMMKKVLETVFLILVHSELYSQVLNPYLKQKELKSTRSDIDSNYDPCFPIQIFIILGPQQY